MTYFLSPVGTSCRFAYAADAPLFSLPRHFPSFIGEFTPKEEARVLYANGALYLFDGQRYFVAVYIEFLLISVQIGGNRFG